jgi:capsular polysaccharide biosynthesis protein
VALRDYIDILLRRGWIILLVAVVAAVGAFGVSKLLPKEYRATVQLSINPARSDWGLYQSAKDTLRNYVLNIKTHRMAQKVIDRAQLDMNTYEFLADIDIAEDSSTLSITINATRRDPEEARLMAQTLAEEFVAEREDWNQDQDLRDRIYASIVDDVRDVPLFSPKVNFNTLAGAIFGALVGGVIVFFLEWLAADILQSPADVERVTGLTVLGTIPAGTEEKQTGRRPLASFLPAWLNASLMLVFLSGIVIGAALGALIVALL